jgi:hypothetical protein
MLPLLALHSFVFKPLNLDLCLLYILILFPQVFRLDLVVYTFTSTASPTPLLLSLDVRESACLLSPKALSLKSPRNLHNAYKHHPLRHLPGLRVNGPILRWLVGYAYGIIQHSSERSRKLDTVLLALSDTIRLSPGSSRTSLGPDWQHSPVLP